MTERLQELRRYLSLPGERRHLSPHAAEFDAFLSLAQKLFALRNAAEERFRGKRWLARREEGALPLDWAGAARVLSPEAEEPRAGLETILARDLPAVLTRIFEDIRKQLRRDRRPVPVGDVRQIDSGCLRWLLRRPGRCVAEKAGARQRVLGVVREEDYDTLENRVLKDLLLRVRTLTDVWLDEFRGRFRGNATFRRVASLNTLCVRGLEMEAFGGVGALPDLPTPNFVLQQDNRYTRVWKAYRRVIRWTRILEGLWERQEALGKELRRCGERAGRLARNRFLSELWVCPVEGGGEAFERPLWEETEEFAGEGRAGREGGGAGLRVVDLMGERLNDILLRPDGRHPNAKPRLIDFERPCIDFALKEEPENRGRALRLSDVWRERQDASCLADYFHQLKDRIGGDSWILLVPDNWDDGWQEKVLGAAAQAFGSRREKVFLLWRTVAFCLGLGAGDGRAGAAAGVTVDGARKMKVSCTRQDGWADTAVFHFDGESRRPMRSSFRLHKWNYGIPELGAVRGGPSLPGTRREGGAGPGARAVDGQPFLFSPIVEGGEEAGGEVRGGPSLLSPFWKGCEEADRDAGIAQRGARRFHARRKRGEVSFYDELEGLHLVVQTDSEEVKFVTLIPPDRKCPGGETVRGDPNRETHLKKGEGELKLWLQFTDSTHENGDLDGELRRFAYELPKPPQENATLELRASVSPGQGLVRVTFANVLDQSWSGSFPLDETKVLREADVCAGGGASHLRSATLRYIVSHIDRSFPPTSSRVYAEDALWDKKVQINRHSSLPLTSWEYVHQYLAGGSINSSAFYNPENRWPNGVPAGVDPLEILCRNNLFGNVDGHRLPERLSEDDAEKLFQKLNQSLANSWTNISQWGYFIRLIAWTYQCDNPLFDKARRQCLGRLKTATGRNGVGISPQVFTLLANLCTRPEEWKICLNCIYQCLTSGRPFVNEEEYWRLFYNLMQFHPEFAKETGLADEQHREALEKITCSLCSLCERVGKMDDGSEKSKLQGYLLKCILYLLRCRRYDGKRFLMDPEGPLRKKTLEALDALRPVWSKVALCNLVRAYICGKGTIDGLPTS